MERSLYGRLHYNDVMFSDDVKSHGYCLHHPELYHVGKLSIECEEVLMEVTDGSGKKFKPTGMVGIQLLCNCVHVWFK